MNTNDTLKVSIKRLEMERTLAIFREFRGLLSVLEAAKDDSSFKPSMFTWLEKECKASMIRVLMQEHPPWDAIRDLSPSQRDRFLVNLSNYTSGNQEGDFPSIAGSYWNWPPPQGLIERVLSKITNYGFSLRIWRY